MKFKVIAGIHQGPDPDWQPPASVALKGGKYVDKDGVVATDPETGRAYRPPTRTYRTGETVTSDTDLAARFGAEKFVRVGKVVDEDEGVPPVGGAAAPHGQVTQGFQSATSLPDGRTVSGLADRGELKHVLEAKGDEPAGRKASAVDLDGMTVAELREHAAAEEIDLHGATHKADIVKAIKRAK